MVDLELASWECYCGYGAATATTAAFMVAADVSAGGAGAMAGRGASAGAATITHLLKHHKAP